MPDEGRNERHAGHPAGDFRWAGVVYSPYGEYAARLGSLAPYLVHLHFERAPLLEADALAAAVARRLGARPNVRPSIDETLISFAEGADTSLPLLSRVSYVLGAVEFLDGLVIPSIRQTYDWPEVDVKVGSARVVLAVGDSGGASLTRADRCRAFDAVVAGCIDLLHPSAINWLPAQRFVSVGDYIGSFGDLSSEFDVLVNVRMIRVEDEPGTVIMDSFGMRNFDLPDIQISFTRLDPNVVAGWLKAVAYYLFRNGDVIADDEWVDGLMGNTKFYCRHEAATVGPPRPVLNIDAGAFAPRTGRLRSTLS